MNLDELGPSWRKQNDSLGRSSASALAGVIRRAERERLTNLFFGIVGVIATLQIMWVFAPLIVRDPSMFVRAGATMCILAGLGILPSCVLAVWPSRSTDQSTCNYLSQELRRTEKTLATNQSPYYFGLLTLVTAGVCLIGVGRLPRPTAVLTIVGALVIYIVTVWATRIIVRRSEQLRVDLEALLGEFRQETSAS